MESSGLATRIVMCLPILGGMSVSLVTPDGADQVTVVANGGFEAGPADDDDPVNWNATRVPAMESFVSFQWDSVTVHSGRRSVSISVQDNHPKDKIYYNWNQSPLDCKPGETYELTGWVKAKNLTESAFILIQCWDRGMDKVLGFANTNHAANVAGTTDWVEVRVALTIPKDTWRIVVLAGIPGHSNSGGTVWFDDITLVRVSSE